jgi:DNA-binding HxlR family transcriptional regulator
MATRTSLKDDTCPVARSMEAIGDCWSMLIIRDAMLGKKRFGEFQKSLGVAKNILSMRLRALVDDGLLKLEPAADGSAYQDYVLTEKGRAVFPIMVALRQWAEEFAFRPGEATNIMVDRETGQRIRKLELRAADGRLLHFGEVMLKPATA